MAKAEVERPYGADLDCSSSYSIGIIGNGWFEDWIVEKAFLSTAVEQESVDLKPRVRLHL